MTGLDIRLADQVVIGMGILVLLAIGGICSRRNKTDEGYFLAGRSMPSWVVGLSLMATIVSSMTFLALPAFAFGNGNWRNCLANFTYLPAIVVAIYLFIPLYRRTRVNSAYEYLERRFGLWARLYAAATFVLFHFFRTGVVLYAVSLGTQSILNTDEGSLPTIIIVGGILVSVYTIVGGLQAVIWTDVFQAVALIGGGLVCLPVIVSQLPGGIEQLFRVAVAENKFDLGSYQLTLAEKTIWAYLVAEFVLFLQMLGTDQTNVQRYSAAASDKAASRAAVIGCCLAIPTWTYFLFLGTSLFVFVKVVPQSGLEGLDADQVFPRFILTHVPAGIGGLVITGLLASAMSTLDSSINATAATVTTDFYKRLWVKNREPRHYAHVGMLVSLLFSVVMITTACGIHYFRVSQTLDDLQRMLLSILGGGLLSLFLVGFVTVRVDSRAVMIATATTVVFVASWVLLGSPFGQRHFPALAVAVPDHFWVSTFANLLLFGVAYGASLLIRNRRDVDLTGLTIWRSKHDHSADR
jgi:SSS family solute:Na+ symporter